MAAESAKVAVWTCDLRTFTLRFLSAWKPVLGREESALPLAEIWELVHPDDRARTIAALNEHLEGRAAVYESEQRMLHADGSYRWVLSRGVVSYDDQDWPSHFSGADIDVTDRKTLEETLQRSEERFRYLVENITDVIYTTDLEGRVTYMSPVAERLYGYSAAEMLDRPFSDFIFPEDLAEVAGGLRQAVSGNPQPHDHRIVSKAGNVCWVRNNTTAIVKDGRIVGLRGIISDVTDRRLAEDSLRALTGTLEQQVAERTRETLAATERIRLITDNTSDMLSQVSLDGVYQYVSPAHERILGYATQELLGKSVVDLLHPDDLDRITNSIQEVLGGAATEKAEFRYRHADGHYVWMETTGKVLLDDDGSPYGAVLAGRDITERRHLEAELRQSHKMEAVGRLAGGIAHDFNNILGAIIGNVELATQDVGRGHPAVESLDEIAKASRRAKDLVHRILAFSRQQQPSQSVMSLQPIVDESVSLLRVVLPAGIELVTTLDPDTPPVRADASHIHQVLVNLCTNAWQALEARVGRIDVALDAVTVDAEDARASADLRAGLFARLSVTDAGEGMDAATLERIFEPFFTTKSAGGGTGLGLSVVHGIVKAHGGAIAVTSAPGKGTRFCLYFPAVETVLPGVAGEAPGAKPLPAVGGQHVLYVDDEEALVLLVTRTLERSGFRVSGYTRAEEAVAAVRADPGGFDVVVTDFNMPRLSGLDVARELSRLRSDLPVVLASGYITEELRAQATEAGVREMIYKPNTVEELCEVVRRIASAPKIS
ncbi:MAG: PAS domain S-box protein [Deltaproteobacteria bacterium]|nr:PAS domain S-box protein [Deltaproteobacteria bacterium]